MTADRWERQIPPSAGGATRLRPFDLHRSEADAIAVQQHLIGGGGLTIHADQVVARLPTRNAIGKQLGHRGASIHFDVVREPGTVIINVEDFQGGNSRIEGIKTDRQTLGQAVLSGQAQTRSPSGKNTSLSSYG